MFSPNLEIKLVSSSLTLNPLSEKIESINVLTELILFFMQRVECFHKIFENFIFSYKICFRIYF